MSFQAYFRTGFLSVFEQPQMFTNPLPSTPGGFSNVEDVDLMILFAFHTLDFVANALSGAPDALALGPEADWAVLLRASSLKTIPGIFLHK